MGYYNSQHQEVTADWIKNNANEPVFNENHEEINPSFGTAFQSVMDDAKHNTLKNIRNSAQDFLQGVENGTGFSSALRLGKGISSAFTGKQEDAEPSFWQGASDLANVGLTIGAGILSGGTSIVAQGLIGGAMHASKADVALNKAGEIAGNWINNQNVGNNDLALGAKAGLADIAQTGIENIPMAVGALVGGKSPATLKDTIGDGYSAREATGDLVSKLVQAKADAGARIENALLPLSDLTAKDADLTGGQNMIKPVGQQAADAITDMLTNRKNPNYIKLNTSEMSPLLPMIEDMKKDTTLGELNDTKQAFGRGIQSAFGEAHADMGDMAKRNFYNQIKNVFMNNIPDFPSDSSNTVYPSLETFLLQPKMQQYKSDLSNAWDDYSNIKKGFSLLGLSKGKDGNYATSPGFLNGIMANSNKVDAINNILGDTAPLQKAITQQITQNKEGQTLPATDIASNIGQLNNINRGGASNVLDAIYGDKSADLNTIKDNIQSATSKGWGDLLDNYGTVGVLRGLGVKTGLTNIPITKAVFSPASAVTNKADSYINGNPSQPFSTIAGKDVNAGLGASVAGGVLGFGENESQLPLKHFLPQPNIVPSSPATAPAATVTPTQSNPVPSSRATAPAATVTPTQSNPVPSSPATAPAATVTPTPPPSPTNQCMINLPSPIAIPPVIRGLSDYYNTATGNLA
jgi:cell division septation protein DedD